MRYLLLSLLLGSSAVLADARVVPDGMGGYRIYEYQDYPQYRSPGRMFSEFGNRESIYSRAEQIRTMRQQRELMRLEAELMRRQLQE